MQTVFAEGEHHQLAGEIERGQGAGSEDGERFLECMVNWNRVKESGEILIIATAAFAFYKLITAIIAMVKDRKHSRPIDSSVRMLELTQAIFAIFSLQAGLLHIFGTGEAWEHWMNLAAGCAVCMLTVAIGIYMIRRGNREIKKLQEENNG